MSDLHIHIISLDVPLPADYGGAIDIFYRIKALHALGVKIHLHCFEYGRGEQPELEKYCEEVYYYKRKRRIIDLFGSRPFIVKSRISDALLNNILGDDYPILFEGLHTTWYLEHPEVHHRITLVRAHNIEHEYYFGLMQNSSRIKKLYFKLEHKKLERYEAVLHYCSAILPIRLGDLEHFRKYNKHCLVLPASLPEFSHIDEHITEDYCLFHGNLSVPENDQAATWLLTEVWKNKDLPPLIITGKDPSEALIELAKQSGCTLIANPTDDHMQELLQKAKIHVLYTTQPTGLKLKLLAALQTNGDVLVNTNMVSGTGLEEWCTIADNAVDFENQIRLLASKSHTSNQYDSRKAAILEKYDTLKNCNLILELIASKK